QRGEETHLRGLGRVRLPPVDGERPVGLPLDHDGRREHRAIPLALDETALGPPELYLPVGEDVARPDRALLEEAAPRGPLAGPDGEMLDEVRGEPDAALVDQDACRPVEAEYAGGAGAH